MTQFIITATTCGLNCWHAVEEVCRCSCGGVNHSCLRGEHGVQPVRTCKIDGVMRELAGVGDGVADEAKRLNLESGEFYWPIAHAVGNDMPHVTAKIKTATADQLTKWPELKAYREANASLPPWKQSRPYLLWTKKAVTA